MSHPFISINGVRHRKDDVYQYYTGSKNELVIHFTDGTVRHIFDCDKSQFDKIMDNHPNSPIVCLGKETW